MKPTIGNIRQRGTHSFRTCVSFQRFELIVDRWPVAIGWIIFIYKSLRVRLVASGYKEFNEWEWIHTRTARRIKKASWVSNPGMLFVIFFSTKVRIWVSNSILFASCVGFSVAAERNRRSKDQADGLLPISALVRDYLTCELGNLIPDVESTLHVGG